MGLIQKIQNNKWLGKIFGLALSTSLIVTISFVVRDRFDLDKDGTNNNNNTTKSPSPIHAHSFLETLQSWSRQDLARLWPRTFLPKLLEADEARGGNWTLWPEQYVFIRHIEWIFYNIRYINIVIWIGLWVIFGNLNR